VALIEEVSVVIAPNPVTTVAHRVAERRQEARGGAVASAVLEKNKRRGKRGGNDGDEAAPLLNGHGGVGDSRRRASRGGKEWGMGRGGGASRR
jgi:hypothetical protein